jgi:hypothetical protein
MPQALRLEANPPFQRVEETNGAHQKSTLVRNCKGVFVALQHVKCFKMKKTAKPFEFSFDGAVWRAFAR